MKKILICLLAFNASVCTFAQTVKTHAGQQYVGSGSYTGYRNNLTDSVLFSNPLGIEVDTAGRLYVSNEHNIFWIKDKTAFLAVGYSLDPNTPGAADSKDFAGSVARFSRPAGLSINPGTNELIVADMDNHQIRKVEHYINNATQQVVNTVAGVKILNGDHKDGANTAAKFSSPAGVAVAANGDIYVADRNNHCIRKISGGNVSTIAGLAKTSGHVNGTGNNARFYAPYNLILDGNDLLVADYGNKAIRKINLTTLAVTDLITGGLDGPKDLCKVGNTIYIAEQLCVKRYDNNVLSIYVGSASQQGYVNADGASARFEDITGIVYHPKDKLLYVVDMGNNVVRSISPNARPSASFTSSTTNATKGQIVILTSTSVNRPSAFRWVITPGNYSLQNNSKMTDSLIYVSFGQIGSYSVKLVVSNFSGADSVLKNNHIIVTSVTAAPVADFKASKTTPATNEVISLIDMSSNTPTSWRWRISPVNFIFVNGTDSLSQVPNIKFTNGNNFDITLIVTNAEGTDTLIKTAYIKVNGTSVNTVFTSAGLSVYPNPAHEYLFVESPEQGRVQIVSMDGKSVFNAETSDTLTEISTSEFAAGAYILYYYGASGTRTRKFIVY
jgi:PKD repeat protein